MGDLGPDSILDATDLAVRRARQTWNHQAVDARWDRIRLDKSVRALIQGHFIIGILDAESRDWVVPTQPPERAFLLYLAYMCADGLSLRKAKGRLPMLKEQFDAGGYWRQVFAAGQSASYDPDALRRVLPLAIKASPDVTRTIRRAQLKAVAILVMLLLGATITGSIAWKLWGAYVLRWLGHY